MAPVLRRVVGMLAAQAELPVDRVDVAVATVAAFSDDICSASPDSVIRIEIEVRHRMLSLAVGPLYGGLGDSLRTMIIDRGAANLATTTEIVVEQVAVAGGDGQQRLRFELAA